MTSFTEDYDMESVAGKPPISTHSAFPPIVALWFAALLGVGSMVVPVALIEQLVVSTGISSVVSVAAPPLGMTARILIALAFALSGALAGLFIARQVAKAHALEEGMDFAEPETTSSNRKPISAHDELGDEGLDGNAKPRGRRALAMDLEEFPGDNLEEVPLPGAQPDVLALADQLEDAPGPDEDSMPGFTTLAETPEEEPSAQTLDFVAEQDDAIDSAWVEAEPDEEPVLEEPVLEEPVLEDYAELISEEPVAEADPLEFSPPPLAPEDEADFEDEQGESIAVGENLEQNLHDFVALEIEQEVVAEFVAQIREEAKQESPRHSEAGQDDTPQPDWQDTPIADMGLIQLAQRLSSSIEKRRAMLNAKAELADLDAKPQAPLAPDFEVAAAEEAAQAKASYFNQAIEAAPAIADEAADQQPAQQHESTPWTISLEQFAHLDLGSDESDEEEDDTVPDLVMPVPVPFSRADSTPTFTDEEMDADEMEADEADDLEETEFGSLLSMQKPAPTPQEALGDDQQPEPAEVNTPADSDETERALREALLNLQRMSGTA